MERVSHVVGQITLSNQSFPTGNWRSGTLPTDVGVYGTDGDVSTPGGPSRVCTKETQSVILT